MSQLLEIFFEIAVDLLNHVIGKENIREIEKMHERKFVMRRSKILVVMVLVGAVSFDVVFVLTLIFAKGTDRIYYVLLAFLPAILFTYAYMYYSHWELRIEGGQIKYLTLTSSVRTYSFSDIKKVIADSDGTDRLQLKVCSDKKKLFVIDSFCTCYDLFAYRLYDENIEIVQK